tara:strand:- start:5882 stop:6631 length:750 start_codon:yes stop_codon:yes gene_type:complete
MTLLIQEQSDLKKTVSEITLISFDLDNTLWDVSPVISSAEFKMRQWLNKNIQQFDQLYNRNEDQQLKEELIRRKPHLKHNLSSLRREFLQEAISTCGYKQEQASELAETAFNIFYEERHNVTFFDGALEVLKQLSGQFTLAILTNGNADYNKLGLGNYFSFSLSAADLNASKPDPAMFNAVLDRAGRSPNQAIHVGDSLVDDIAGASQVGMRTIWVNLEGLSPDDTLAIPDAAVESLREIPDAIKEICV